ncbi:NADH dehydrogenase [ubiquinone] 1 beta subcomplex subunit 6 [Malaya genurostris]|uniref:NADH dehydrogenase [ubiquinone] 1 beta subcomplex subunit 6 n=1 Tax=Malaya genurostris TaxID=325434 RepID=UPI0026F393E4|nr:NADH dehydrogenase [ubiquinone] 1 beta subcomplex subunit 6 [Malaya genurostris]
MTSPASQTGGATPMTITGRMVRERERLLNMTPEERMWRAQWLKDQQLSPNEPRFVPEYWRERINPIRRFYRAPLDLVQKGLTPVIGHNWAFAIRFWTGKIALAACSIYAGYYYFKYNQNDWTRKGGWRVISSRNAVFPGDEGFPNYPQRSSHSDYAARGFKESPI